MAKTTIVGLDIGTTQVRATEIVHGSGRKPGTVVRAGAVPLAAGSVRDGEVVEQSTVASAIRTLWQQAKFTSKDVAIGVGNQRVIVRDLEIPWIPAEHIRQALPYQVQEILPMPTDDALLDYFATGEHDGEQGRMLSGIFVGAVKDTVTANVLAVEAAGLRPQIVDLNAFAIMRALSRGMHSTGVVAFVDIGARITNIIVADNGSPRLVRTLASGGDDLTDVIASALQMPQGEAERLKRQHGLQVAQMSPEAAEAVNETARRQVDAVRNTLSFYSQKHAGRQCEAIVLSGGGSQLGGFGQYIASATRLRTSLADPFETLQRGKGVPVDDGFGRDVVTPLSAGLAMGVIA